MNGDTLLHRQVNPAWNQDGRITSQVFIPTPKDQNCLSVYDGDLMTAEEAWCHYTRQLEFASVGVMAVTVGECKELALSAESDPTPFPAHAVIKFGELPTSRVRKLAKRLREAAVARGWQYQPEVDA